MWQKFSPRKYLRLTASICAGIVSSSWLIGFKYSDRVLAQDNSDQCTNIVNPLTSEEEIYARTAWQYFLNNYQENTGFTNSADGYP